MEDHPYDGDAAVLAAVVTRSGKMLLTRRLHGPVLWKFPGGKRKPGEPLHMALLRELREETGLDLLSKGRTWEQIDRRVVYAGYRVRPNGSGSGEHRQYFFVVVVDEWEVYSVHNTARKADGSHILSRVFALSQVRSSRSFLASQIPLLEKALGLSFFRGHLARS
jgi:8-oxo-dGTP pyrophosphatase MutT (NUDIX family)